MKTVLAGFLFIFALPFIFAAIQHDSVIILAALAAASYTVLAGAPCVWALAIIIRRNVRRVR